jgi:hypothetical protein
LIKSNSSTSDDRRLHLMSQRRPPGPARKKKRKGPEPEELPSSATVEITGYSLKRGILVQNRIIEPIAFDPRIPPDLGPSFDESIVFGPGPQQDTSQPPASSDDSPSNANASRSVSVSSPSLPRHRRLIPLPGESSRVASRKHHISLRNPSPRSSFQFLVL